VTSLLGAGRLTWLTLRRDRISTSAWVVGLSAFVAATTALFVSDFEDHDYLVEQTRIVATNAGMRLLGLSSGPTVGGYMLHREFVTLAALAALLSASVVVRHTRQDEELGRAELLGASAIGRYAQLFAAVVAATLADLALAIGVAFAVLANGLPTTGSLLVGASVASVGLVFVGVAAVAAQTASTGRGAIGICAAVLGGAFLLSGLGNMLGSVDASGTRVTSTWFTWLSPIGWAQQVRPYGGDHLWPLGLNLVLAFSLVATAGWLVGHRDLGRGMAATRPGPRHASPRLLSTAGLAWRLQRGVLVGWAVALGVFGLILGSLSDQIRQATGATADFYMRTGGSDQILDAYRTSIIQMAGMFVAIYLVQVLLHLHTDEAGGTLEPVLATHVSRARWLLGTIVNAVLGSTALMLCFATCMALASGLVLGGTGRELTSLWWAALVQVPGILVLGAMVVAAVGLVPRLAAPSSWTLLLLSLVLGPMFGPGFGLPQWILDLSPFTHLPKAPANPVSVAQLVVVTVTGLALVALGLAALRRRDLELPA
jgi:ABC-2 type transport system permease protein